MITRILLVVSIVLFGAVGDNSEKRVPCIRHFQSLNYDPLARQTRSVGDVHMRMCVDKDGNVEDIQFLPPLTFPLLQKSAAENIKRWTFEPGDKFEFVIVYEFRLSEPELDYPAPSYVTIDFPDKVHIESYYATIMRD